MPLSRDPLKYLVQQYRAAIDPPPEPPELLPPDGYYCYVPLECGSHVKIAQGNFGDFSHQGKAKYAYDFSVPLGTPLVAMADGIVNYTYTETGPGDPCYEGGGPECFPYANMVLLFHGDGTDTIYKHLNEVWVSEGEFVKRGTIVGLSGSTGYSTGPHAHLSIEHWSPVHWSSPGAAQKGGSAWHGYERGCDGEATAARRR